MFSFCAIHTWCWLIWHVCKDFVFWVLATPKLYSAGHTNDDGSGTYFAERGSQRTAAGEKNIFYFAFVANQIGICGVCVHPNMFSGWQMIKAINNTCFPISCSPTFDGMYTKCTICRPSVVENFDAFEKSERNAGETINAHSHTQRLFMDFGFSPHTIFRDKLMECCSIYTNVMHTLCICTEIGAQSIPMYWKNGEMCTEFSCTALQWLLDSFIDFQLLPYNVYKICNTLLGGRWLQQQQQQPWCRPVSMGSNVNVWIDDW